MLGITDRYTDKFYEEYGLKKFDFFEKVVIKNGKKSIQPGFFTPYRSCNDYNNQVKAPFIMLGAIVVKWLVNCIKGFWNLFLLGVNLLRFDTKKVSNSGQEWLICTINSYGYKIAALFDIMGALIALITRSIATIVAGVNGLLNSTASTIKNVFSSDAVNPQPMLTPAG